MSAREEELLRRVEALAAETERDAARVAREYAALDERRASLARRGELGRDWQEVQARIDDGRTTIRDVFGGHDDSPVAVRLRDRSRARLDDVRLPEKLTVEIEALQRELP
jgi:hypothetical protein